MPQGRSTKIISTITWIRTSRLSKKNSLSLGETWYGESRSSGRSSERKKWSTESEKNLGRDELWFPANLHGYLAHQKTPTPLGPPWDPRHRPTESCGGGVSCERGPPVISAKVRITCFRAWNITTRSDHTGNSKKHLPSKIRCSRSNQLTILRRRNVPRHPRLPPKLNRKRIPRNWTRRGMRRGCYVDAGSLNAALEFSREPRPPMQARREIISQHVLINELSKVNSPT